MQKNTTGAEFLSDLNVLLSTSVGLNKNVKIALKRLGEYKEADQVYVVNINHDMTFTISEEWTKTGASVFGGQEGKNSFYYDKKLERELEQNNYIYIRDIQSVTNEGIRNMMEAMRVHCAIFLPLYISSHQFSFLCLSRCCGEVSWPDADIAFLIQVSSVLSGALERELILKKLVKHHALYQDFIENRVDYIVRLNRHLHVSFSNKTFYKLFGDSPDDIIGNRIGDLMTGMDISNKQLEGVTQRMDTILTFHATVAPRDEVIFIEWYAYPVKLDRDHLEIHLIGHNVTKYKEMERELTLLKTELTTFTETMFPMWESIRDSVLHTITTGRDDEVENVHQKMIVFNWLYEELLSKIDYNFAPHAHRS